MRMGVAGISGRMGRLVAEEVVHAGATLAGGLSRDENPAGVLSASDALIDFTTQAAATPHAEAVCAAGCAWILGTTGLTASDEAAVRQAATQIPVVWAANFSPGLTLLLDLTERLAASLPAAAYDAEILEMHHRQKRDAPSGTALALARAVAAGRATPNAARATHDRTGARPDGAIGFASLRGGQVVGDHTLLFAGDAEQISISHRALDRRIFARGAVQAALWTRGRPPGLYTMRDVLGLPPAPESPPAP